MISTIIFDLWLFGMIVTLPISIYKVTTHLVYNGADRYDRILSENTCRYTRDYAIGETKTSMFFWRLEWCSLIPVITALSVFSVFVLPPIYFAKNKVNNERKLVEDAKESLRILAEYETNPLIKSAMLSGDPLRVADAQFKVARLAAANMTKGPLDL